MIDLSKLNSEQKKVVTSTEGPVLVLAGAGSGKTRSVIYRTAYLIHEKNVSPWNILVVTFTNKAARELRDRLENTFNISTHSLWIGTFHSVCTRILRYEQEHLHFDSNFSIYDEVDQKSVFKKIYKKLQIDPDKFPIGRVRNIISRQKNNLILPELFFKYNERNYYSEIVAEIYSTYQKFLLDNNALDFDDLLMYTAILFYDNQKIRKKYEEKFKYIMIDEYQDTNYAQFKIINLIAQNHQNLCVVGDDDQAIYSWRGANIRNILNFEKDYKNVLTIKLELNYRSPESILKLANDLIKHNDERHPKELRTKIISKEKPELAILENENGEAEFVVDEISRLRSKNENLNECVILYRTNAQSRVFERSFFHRKIKYQIVGGINFYQRKEIKDIIAYLRILVNPADSESLLRIINFPVRGIGKKTIEKIVDFGLNNKYSFFESLQNSGKNNFLNLSSKRKISDFLSKINEWREKSESLPITDLIKMIIDDIHLMKIHDFSDDPKDISRVENIREFIAAATEFSDNFSAETGNEPLLTDYLQNISLQTDLDHVDENEESVKLMTMHNAKGLEFDHVFIVGLEDGLLPHSRSIENEKDLQEERRLFYVAVTRAKKTLILSYTRSRRTFDKIDYPLPSRFIAELDENLYLKKELHIEIDFKFNIRTESPIKPVLESQKYYKVGQKIAHQKFGKGVILNVDGRGNDAKLTISFANGQLKKIMGSYVKVL